MLTDLAIRALPPPPSGVRRYWDKDGLCVQVSQGGTKTFYLVHGTDRRFLKLGRYPDLSLAKAREEVRKIGAKKILGLEDEISNYTLQDAIDRYLATHCDVNNKPRTAQETRRLLAYLAPLAKRRLSSVGTQHLLQLIGEASPSISEQRHVFVAARALLRWTVRQRMLKFSPLHDLQPPGQVRTRNRVLSDDELSKIYRAAIELGYPYGQICLIAIHTGLRRGEVGSLRWDFISDEHITLPPTHTKNGREHVLPNLIGVELKQVPRTHTLLFPSSVGTPYSTWSDGKEALDVLCDIQDFVFHDFRRYLSTTMAKLRVPIDVTEAILNHVTGSRTPLQRVYDRYDRLPEMREALELYERHLHLITR